MSTEKRTAMKKTNALKQQLSIMCTLKIGNLSDRNENFRILYSVQPALFKNYTKLKVIENKNGSKKLSMSLF
jgi:hypothetical protein